MFRNRRRAALCRATNSVARVTGYCCEPLEQRTLLAGDPVIVLVEPVQDYVVDLLQPVGANYLWTSPDEHPFDPHSNGVPDDEDVDNNGYNDDLHGWNFVSQSPVFAYPNSYAPAGHGSIVTTSVLNVIDTSRVKIMYVITNVSDTLYAPGELRYGTDALNYILAKYDAGVNIVAVGTIVSRTDRAGAEALNARGIMLIGGLSNAGNN